MSADEDQDPTADWEDWKYHKDGTEWDPDDLGVCSWCGGDGWTECEDPIECMNTHSADGCCECDACGGRGYGQSIW